jgi:uncharacterized NAD(P)/FAD-binding protein YdhS
MTGPIVIIGGGFCGTVLAANLLRRPPPELRELVLVERSARMGRGIAYAVREYPFLLNVPASRLSADSSDPLQFLAYARRINPHAGPEDFLPRAWYGDYLEDALARAERAAPASLGFRRVHAEAQRVRRDGAGRWLVEVAGREPLIAEDLILALGNPAPKLLPFADRVREHPGYRNDPWNYERTLGAQHAVLIIGNGLTMADVVLSLSANAAQTPAITTISRHGLLPLEQTEFRPTAVQGDGAALIECATSLRRLMAASRDLSREVARVGGDWREAVTFLRHLAPAIWQRLPDVERRRFLRHVQAHWEVHRHRLPQQIGARLAALRAADRLRILAGRIVELAPEGDLIRAVWRGRGATEPQSMLVHAVINATGPDYTPARHPDSLVQGLLADGWITADPLQLGVLTGAHGACLDGHGRPAGHLYYLGPWLRAEAWEATAVPELRNRADQLAAHLGGAAPDGADHSKS